MEIRGSKSHQGDLISSYQVSDRPHHALSDNQLHKLHKSLWENKHHTLQLGSSHLYSTKHLDFYWCQQLSTKTNHHLLSVASPCWRLFTCQISGSPWGGLTFGQFCWWIFNWWARPHQQVRRGLHNFVPFWTRRERRGSGKPSCILAIGLSFSRGQHLSARARQRLSVAPDCSCQLVAILLRRTATARGTLSFLEHFILCFML